MADWLERVARLAALSERVTTLSEGVKRLAGKVEDHEKRIVRIETIIEIAKPAEGVVLRIASPTTEGT
jgi:hypothetical protein